MLANTTFLWYTKTMEMMVKISELEQEILSLKTIVASLSEQNDKLSILSAEQTEIIARQSELIEELRKQNRLQKEQSTIIEELIKQQSAQTELIEKQTALIKHYEEQFALAQRRQFGSSSERSPYQLKFENFFNEAEDQADPSLPEPTLEEITYKRKKRTGKRKEDLSGLPVERIDYELPEDERKCPKCNETMTDMGVNIRDELEVEPAKVINKQHAEHAYECNNKECEKKHGKQIIRAKAPAPLIAGSLASPSAVAHIATQKYVNRIPLYQIEKSLSYDGVVLSRQVMSNWQIICSQRYLVGIYSLLKVHLLMETVQHADETPLQVLHEPGRAAKTKSYEWLYRTSGCAGHQIVIYEYQMTRSWDHPKEFLKDFKGYLHCDGYDAYHDLPDDITVVGCWSHARRPWEELYETIPAAGRDGSNAERGLVYINLLFAFEHEYSEMTPEERFKKRLKQSKPVSDDYFEWVDTLQAPPKSLLGKAIDYSISQRVFLENIYLDGRLEISNNRAERSIKPFVQGRKQWLFSNTPNGAESSSIYFSLIETAKENNLNPYQYLKLLLEKLPSATTDDLESLLPWGDGIPDYCKIPVKASNVKPEKAKYSSRKGPLHNALQKLRAKYAEVDSS